jgi:transposase
VTALKTEAPLPCLGCLPSKTIKCSLGAGLSPVWAAKFLDQWCAQVMRSRLEPMKKVAKTIRAHKQLILNWFEARNAISLGVVEGQNNKAKVVIRKSYGFKTSDMLKISLYQKLGKLPVPEFAHEYF